MSIFNILFRNSGQKARTLKPEDHPVIPAGYRGTLEHDINLCIGCSTCALVCSPGAITLETQPDGIVYWHYNALRCTYCSRCAEYCPTKAIHLGAAAPAAALALHGPATVTSGLTTRHMVKREFCTRCGQPFTAIPLPLLQQMMERDIFSTGSEDYDMPSLMRMCEKCRSRVASQRIKDSLSGVLKISRR